jgi:hypothetical protein
MAQASSAMATTRLHALGQSLWLDNITRGLLTGGALRRYIDEWSVTGLTSRLRTLFANDASRRERLSAEAAGLYVDDSKNRITDETIRPPVALADACGSRDRVEAMFQGEKNNTTEERAVLHVALRARRDASVVLDGHAVAPGEHEVLDRMAAFADEVRNGRWRGHTGRCVRTVINIGIGGLRSGVGVTSWPSGRGRPRSGPR